MGKIYENNNQILLQSLIKIYQPCNFDWLSYQITKKNILTLHHIIKVENGGNTEKENCALLTKRSHRALHICENEDFILYSEINDFFKEVICTGQPIDDFFASKSKEYKHFLVRTIYKNK